MPLQLLSVVAPAYNEHRCIPELVERVHAVLNGYGIAWELVLVDDGSTDVTWAAVQEAAARYPSVRGVRLSRNFGHQAAITAGMRAARGDAVVTMDADLQHPPEVIPMLMRESEQGHDVVYAVRGSNDSESWFKVKTANAFYTLLNRLTRLDLPHGGADFRLMRRDVVDVLNEMPERHRFLRGLTRWTGFSQTSIEYDRGPRVHGESKYSATVMLRFAWDAIVSFTALPLRAASIMGVLVSLGGFAYLIYVVAIRLTTESTVPGWTSLLVVALLLGGAQLACLGVIGQYLGRMFDEIKRRPLYVVRDTVGERDVLDGVEGVHQPERSNDFA